MPTSDQKPLAEFRVPVQLRLSALWASTMFCYVYGDYFGLFVPGSIADMNLGRMGPLGVATPGVLVAVSAMMAIPSLMVVLSLLVRPWIGRPLNIALGIVYTVIVALTMAGAVPFYLFFGVIEIGLTLAIVWSAWTWPRQAV